MQNTWNILSLSFQVEYKDKTVNEKTRITIFKINNFFTTHSLFLTNFLNSFLTYSDPPRRI